MFPANPVMPKRFVQKEFAKSRAYRSVLGAIAKTGRCPFCPENFRYHKKPILRRSGGWLATENSWPYAGTRVHCLLISTRHRERFEDLSLKDFAAIRRLTGWLIRKYGIAGGGLAIRFGDPRFTGATVRHLHVQLIQPARDHRGKVQTVQFPIG